MTNCINYIFRPKEYVIVTRRRKIDIFNALKKSSKIQKKKEKKEGEISIDYQGIYF